MERRFTEGQHNIGTFIVQCRTIIVSDPCYMLGTWCQAVISGVKNGTWTALVDVNEEGKISALTAMANGGIPVIDFKILDLGVDSGQLGIFDHELYGTSKCVGDRKWLNPYYSGAPDPKQFYSACCDITISDKAGVIKHGCVAETGGDGTFSGKKWSNEEGEIVKVEVKF